MEYTGKIRYSLTNDYMFKAVLQKNPEALRGLLASLLHIPINEIQSVQIENPIVLGENIDSKTVILDILVRLNDSQRINIELQVVAQSFWIERSLTYLCRLYNNLEAGEEYSEALNAVHIGILDFELFPGEAQFYSENLLMDKNTHRIYSDNLALNVLCLRHIEQATSEDRDCGLYQWAKLFAATTWEELTMIAKNNEIMKDVVVTMKELTEDEKIRLQCEARRRYEMDWKTLQSKLEASQKREADMKKQLDQEREASQKLLRELEALKEKLAETSLHKNS